MRARFAVVPLVAALGGCGSRGGAYSLDVGGDDGGDDRGGGLFLLDGGGAGASQALDAHIEQDHVAVKIVTLSCAGPCADVVVVATGGHAPYVFAWDDGSSSPARHVCPTASTKYSVSVTDTATSGELGQAARSVRVPLTANVIACPDAGGGPVACGQPGTYVGTFTSAQDGGFPVMGPLTLTLALSSSADGAAELVPTGTLNLSWVTAAGNPNSGLVTGTAKLVGRLDCATGQFLAEDKNMQSTLAGLPLPPVDAIYAGQYDPATGSISGTFTWQRPSTAATGGTFAVTFSH